MCLIAVAHDTSERWPLVIAANRDEFYARPTRPAHAWDDDARVIGGRDLRAGGSWLALRRGGRFAAITNVRGVGREEGGGGPSRGLLVSDFVRGNDPPKRYAERVLERGGQYAGFHLIVGDGEVVHCSNGAAGIARVDGIFAISNAPPGTHWPKVDLARDFLAGALKRHKGADNLADDLLLFLSTPRSSTIDGEVFVTSQTYGTRSSTVIIVEASGAALFVEQNYGVAGVREGAPMRFSLVRP
jgi:uncharacterized protein with NRDE domain